MATNSITSANAVYVMTVTGLFTSVQLQGFAADAMFATEATETGEFVMGVDGTFSAGFTWREVHQTISFMPDSASNNLFELWDATEQANSEKIQASATIRLKSTGRKYDLTQGYLRSIPRVPTANKTLVMRPFGVTWGRVTPSPV